MLNDDHAADRPSVTPRVGDAITTAEQLDALPVGTMIRDHMGETHVSYLSIYRDRLFWQEVGIGDERSSLSMIREISGSFTVLHAPGAGRAETTTTDNARADVDSIYYEPPAWCPGCGDRIPTEVIRERGVCSNCYGTTDDPWAAGRAETTTATTEDAARVIREVIYLTPEEPFRTLPEDAAQALAAAGLLARPLPGRDEIAEALELVEPNVSPWYYLDQADAVLALLRGETR